MGLDTQHEDQTKLLQAIESDFTRYAPTLSTTARRILERAYVATELPGTTSPKPVAIDRTRISIEQGAQIHHLIRASGANESVEIGFAYGFSTIWILDALATKTGAVHQAIDPFEETRWSGVGLQLVRDLGDNGVRFEWLSDYSIHSLSQLIKQGRLVDFVFIDGNHRFDDVIVDFYLADQITRIGGLISLDDNWMLAIQTAANFITSNRYYETVDQPVRNMRVFRKVGDDRERSSVHFESFVVAQPPSLRQRLVQKLRREFGRSQPRISRNAHKAR